MNQKPIVKSISKYATPIRSMMRAGTDNEVENEHKSWSAEFDQNGLPIEETKYFDNGQIEEIHHYEYNGKGNTLKHKITVPGEGIVKAGLSLD